MAFDKCCCPNCGQKIEYPSEGAGQIVPCPTCQKPITLIPQIAAKKRRSNLSTLTEETIRAKIKSGNTPVHRAAKNGQFDLIPRHLLTTKLFTIKNISGETPLHIAAKHGHLSKVPPEFLTKELLLTQVGDGGYYTGSGYHARTETVFHIAARCGYADQIPKEFITPEILILEASGYRWTLLHTLAAARRLDLVPSEYALSEMWAIPDYRGQTAREIFDASIEREHYVQAKRMEPATQKQKDKLRFFGYEVPDGMTKGQASDAITECVQRFSEIDQAYYSRPATDEQLSQLDQLLKEEDERIEDYINENGLLTYRDAKDLLTDIQLERRQKEEERFFKECEREASRSNKGSSDWFEKRDTIPEIERKAKAKLAQRGLSNVLVVVGRFNGNTIINLDAPTDEELAKAAKILGIKMSDCS